MCPVWRRGEGGAELHSLMWTVASVMEGGDVIPGTVPVLVTPLDGVTTHITHGCGAVLPSPGDN